MRGILIFLVGFLILFAFRFIYGFTAKSKKIDIQDEFIGDFFSNYEGEKRKNYASSKIDVKYTPVEQVSKPLTIEQKYEKVGSFTSKTDQFEKDNKQVRKLIEGINAVIQLEENTGNKGSRQLHLSIGVRPTLFESFCEEIKKIGTIKSSSMTKTDKTNEFKKLNAQKASLEKVRNSLIDLKNKGGRIDEYIALENRILELESELQDLGVSLGEFDEVNEFCTVEFSLIEGTKPISLSVLHRLKTAFEWSVKYYLMFVLIVVLSLLGSLIFIALADKLKIINTLFKKES